MPSETANKQSNLSFLDLPAELRNEVYGYALKQSHPILPGRGCESPLLLTSHRIRDEGLLMYYGLNDIEFDFRHEVDFKLRAPAMYWAYYHIPAQTMQKGQYLVLKTDRFIAELVQRVQPGKDGDADLNKRPCSQEPNTKPHATVPGKISENPKLGLVLTSLHFFPRPDLSPRDDSFESDIIIDVNKALEYIFWNEDVDMIPWLGHNVVRGLLNHLQAMAHRTTLSILKGHILALQVIAGKQAACEGQSGKLFYEYW